MNFGSLKSRILSIIGRAPNDMVYELVTADINQELRLRVMESTTTLTEAATVSLPSDFLDVVSLYRDTNPRTTLLPQTPDTLQRGFVASGIPAFYAIEDGQLRLSPSPSGSESLILRYIAALPHLSADSDENDVLTTYPSVYVYGSLAHHAALIRDQEALASWFSAYEKAKQQARAHDRRYRSGSGPMVPVPGAVA